MEKQPLSALILAAGKGTRMKSNLAKVLHEVHFRPMVHHVLDAISPLDFTKTILVTGHQAEQVESACAGYDVTFVRQMEQLGTGHAVLAAEAELACSGGVVMILCGDTPLIQTDTLQHMIQQHLQSRAILSVMTTVVDDPTNYGRVIDDDDGQIFEIVEEKDASPDQRKIRKINAGIYCVDIPFLLHTLKGIGTNNKQGEVYLTDIVVKARSAGHGVKSFLCSCAAETLGVNSRMEMAQAHEFLQSRFNEKLMAAGVTLVLPGTVAIAETAVIGRDTVIDPGVYVKGKTVVGENCRIGPGVCLIDSIVGDNVILGAGSYIHGATVTDNAILPPHSRISE
ncbi:MAG: NTP transferase domain-containing protein [Pseudomonadota bacterium]